MMELFFFILLFFPLLSGEESIRNMDFDISSDAAERGEKVLKDYESKNDPCWLTVVSELRSKCSESTDLERSILAMKFANCHFEKSGLQTYGCTSEKDFKSCTKSMNDESQTAFLVYTEFFTHVTDICYYLQSELWREKTAKTISDLSWKAEETVSKLDKSLQNQDLVLESQDKTLLNQRKILENEQNLKDALDSSTSTAREAFREMKQKADEQQAIFSRTFDGIFHGIDKLSKLQVMLLGEFIGLQSLAFYIVSVVSCYFFTSSPRTIGARLILFTFFIVLVGVEKRIVTQAMQNKDHYESSSEKIHADIWFARCIFIIVSMATLGYFAIMYKNYTIVNNKILQEIQEDIKRIYALEIQRNEKTLPQAWEITDGKSGKIKDIPKEFYAINAGCQTQQISSTPKKKLVNPESQRGTLLSDDGYDSEEEIEKKKRFSKKNFIKESTKTKKGKRDVGKTPPMIETSHSENSLKTPRYNLRSRPSTPQTSENRSYQLSAEVTHKRSKKDDVSSIVVSPGFFSSDED